MKMIYSLICFSILMFTSPDAWGDLKQSELKQADLKQKPKICLNMIVKNEKDVIARCLASTLNIIDYWIIVDTGSTDGTQDIIKNFMKEKNVPGELYERPWKNFAHNRNEALDFARHKADYIFFMDADEYLIYEPNFKLPELNRDFYYMPITFGGSRYSRVFMVKGDQDWKWEGVLHEAVGSSVARSSGTFENVYDFVTAEGARSKDPEKYLKDAAVLEEALKEDPNNSRYRFYLAQSYGDAGKNEESIVNYEKRVALGGWDQEVFWSLFKIAELKKGLKEKHEELLKAYNRAFQFRKTRVEPLYHIASLFREKGDFEMGYQVSKIAASLPASQDLLFLQQWMIDYGVELELSICAYWTGRYTECRDVSQNILKKKDIPSNVRECVQRNLEFANMKILEEILEKASKLEALAA